MVIKLFAPQPTQPNTTVGSFGPFLYSVSIAAAGLQAEARNAHSHNAMLAALARSGRFADARWLFDEMRRPTAVAYNSVASGLVHHGLHGEAVRWLARMNRELGSRVAMDRFTVVGVSNSCVQLGCLRLPRQIHGSAIACVIGFNVVAHNAIVDAYGKCGDARLAQLVFDQMPARDVVSWTSMVVAYTMAGQLRNAREVFDEMPTRHSVTWTALISRFAQNERGGMAIEMFTRMQDESAEKNDFTFVGVLSACMSLVLIELGKQVHCYL